MPRCVRANPALAKVRGAAAVVLSRAKVQPNVALYPRPSCVVKIASQALVEVRLLLDEVVNVVCSGAARDEGQNKFHEDRGCHLATGSLSRRLQSRLSTQKIMSKWFAFLLRLGL